jgi:hypothetical protein
MITLPHHLHFALRANGLTSRILSTRGRTFDPLPVIKWVNPVGAATWVATELGEDDDTLFGLADLGFGCPELGHFSLREIASVRLPFDLFIERDLDFSGLAPLSVWADTARRTGSILLAEAELRRMPARPGGPELPPQDG